MTQLSLAERFFVNSPVRRVLQRQEAKRFRELSSLTKGCTVLEIGCGIGYGTELISRHFQPQEIYGVDLDEKMIEMAKKRNPSPHIHFQVGNITHLEFPSESFDGIFDFTILHHVKDWRTALDETARVLKPKGLLHIEDLSIESFQGMGTIWRLTSHPYDTMYTRTEFRNYLTQELGFNIQQQGSCHPKWLFNDFFLIAEKP